MDPKIHKEGIHLRPIVSKIGAPYLQAVQVSGRYTQSTCGALFSPGDELR